MENNKSTEKIDFVIAWVDGNDPVWRAEKDKYTPDEQKGDKRDVRFRDWDILKYWFRTVELFAPWVNRIHFVTWGHVPTWLNTEHPKINIVKHTDYIPEKYLPTFNSHTIELNLHRIKGLAEQFVYFNDDMFITAPVTPEDFFRKGLPCDTFAMNAIYFGKDSVGSINGNNVGIINDHFNKKKQFSANWTKWYHPANGLKKLIRTTLLMPWPWFPGFLYGHSVTNLLKSTMETVWEEAYEELDKTCLDRFRQKTNVNQWIFKYWQLVSGKFAPVTAKDKKCYHVKETVEPVCQSIAQERFKIICINDTEKTVPFETLAKEVRDCFEEKFKEKSAFEK